MAKNVFKFKEHEKTAFFSSPENRCHLTSSLKTEEREFVVDPSASMHMISKKGLSEAEMDILTKSCRLTKVITANGEVQTQEEAIVYVKNCIHTWQWKSSKTRQQYYRSESSAMKTGVPTNGSMVKNLISLRTKFGLAATQELCSYRGSKLVKFLLWIFINFKDTFETGESFFIIFFILTFFTYNRWFVNSRKRRCD